MIAAMPYPEAPVVLVPDFDTVVEVESGRLYAVAFSILRNRAEAEDAVQETMLKAWRAWGAVRDEASRRGWLTRICVNHCLGKRRGPLGRLLRMGPPPTDTPDPSAIIDTADPDMDRAMALLTPHQRAVVVLHYQYGYTLDQCAAQMGCRPGSVRSHLNRALTRLRTELADA